MTRNECMTILSDKNHPQYKELHKIFFENRNKCRKYYNDLGYKGYVLHHKIFNCTNYEEWKIDEIEPMTKSEHSRLHIVVYKQGFGSPESIKRAHETLARKLKSGELQVWNKGKKGVQVSPRKGKTGKEFPFLCASKKGKSGGWNRGLYGLDCLKMSEEAKKKLSIRNSGKGNPAYGRHWYNNGEIQVFTYECPEGFTKGMLKKKSKEDINND